MSIDKKRVAGVVALETSGWVWRQGTWHAPSGAAPMPTHVEISLRFLAALHTDDPAPGMLYKVSATADLSKAPPDATAEGYALAWVNVRRHLGLPN